MLDVVCFGEILWDLFEVERRGHEHIGRTFRRELGGAPANVATGLARLGLRAAVVGGVGRDRFGEALLAHLRADRVDVRFVIRLEPRTGLTFVSRDGRGEPEFVFYRHQSADLSVRADDVKEPMGRARWALVGTSTLVTPHLAAATRRFLDVAQRGGARLFVDLNVRAHLWPGRRAMQRAIGALVERADLVKASDADLRAVADGGQGMGWLERHAPGAAWLITRGAAQASAVGEHGEVHAPALRTRCVDATGAGDAFIAGSLATLVAARAVPGSAAWRDPAVWRAALRAGHMMGQKAVSRVGAVAGLHGLGRVSATIRRVRRSAS
ncbi:MAG TPA: carbohydrate kinase [Polyangiaceae bacterium]|nr:carbohydrate kinase [Polyangiaceae bacterium]